MSTINVKVVKARQIPGQNGGNLFRLLAIFFLHFCGDLAVLIFPTLLTDIKTQLKVDRHSVPTPWVVCPVYSFTLICLQFIKIIILSIVLF